MEREVESEGGCGGGGGGGTRRDAGGVLEKKENSNSNKLIPQNSVRSVGLNRSSRDRQTDTDRERQRDIFSKDANFYSCQYGYSARYFLLYFFIIFKLI